MFFSPAMFSPFPHGCHSLSDLILDMFLEEVLQSLHYIFICKIKWAGREAITIWKTKYGCSFTISFALLCCIIVKYILLYQPFHVRHVQLLFLSGCQVIAYNLRLFLVMAKHTDKFHSHLCLLVVFNFSLLMSGVTSLRCLVTCHLRLLLFLVR